MKNNVAIYKVSSWDNKKKIMEIDNGDDVVMAVQLRE